MAKGRKVAGLFSLYAFTEKSYPLSKQLIVKKLVRYFSNGFSQPDLPCDAGYWIQMITILEGSIDQQGFIDGSSFRNRFAFILSRSGHKIAKTPNLAA